MLETELSSAPFLTLQGFPVYFLAFTLLIDAVAAKRGKERKMTQLDETYERVEGFCNTCKHYDSTAFGKANYGHCRRYPPIAIEKHANDLPRGIWPVVGYDDMCGEHASEEP
jgi:hypothetical protein